MDDRPFIIWTNADAPDYHSVRPATQIGGDAFDPPEGAEAITDLSMTLRSASDADILLATRPPAETLDWLNSRGSLADLRKRGNRLVCVEPVPSGAMAAAVADEADERAAPTQAPLLRHAPLSAALRDALGQFGTIQTALFAARDNGTFGSLGARLTDALDTLSDLLGEAETIDASVATPRSASGVRAAPPDDLSLLHGSLTAHLRFETGASAVLSLSDDAGRWFRGLTLAGEGGLIRFDDHGFEWVDPKGAVVDRTDAPEGAPAERMTRFLAVDSFTATPPTSEQRLRTLAAAAAAVLSARTGQPESPATVRRMANLAG